MVESVRRIASELRPTALDEFGLVEALRLYAKEFQRRTGITINVEGLSEAANVSSEAANAMFRIVQEALTNVLRHAAATKVDIDLRHEGDQTILTITDNGRGIRKGEQDGPGTFGLVGMRERATMLRGELVVEGREGRGTTVTLRVPAADTSSVMHAE
jgi:signal transduction histidine kinase